MNKSKYNFNIKEPINMRLIWILNKSTFYLKCISLIYKLILQFNINSKWIKWLVCGGISQQKPESIFKYKKKRYSKLKPNEVIKELYKNGYLNLTEIIKIKQEKIDETVKYFLSQKAYDSQVPMQSSLIEKSITDLKNNETNYASYSPLISLNCNVIRQIIDSNELKNILDAYLGKTYSLYSVNTMITLPTLAKHAVTKIHRDYDDAHSLACFIYWTETKANNGATFIIPGSHITKNENPGIYLEGKAGSVFLIDTYCLHSGNKNIVTPRIATWLRFGEIPNLAYIVDKNYLFF